MRNNDLTNKLEQANETIYKNAEVIENLKCKNDENKMIVMEGNAKYNAMVTQKECDIARLQDENRLLHDQLRETTVKLSRSNDAISLLPEEGDNMTAINAPQTYLSDLDKDKELPVAKMNDLRTEITSYKNSTTNIENESRELSYEDKTPDIETEKNYNDQLLDKDTRWPLKDILYTLPGKIYERIVYLRGEHIKHDSETENVLELYPSKKIMSEIEDEKKKQEKIKIYAEKVYK